MYGANEVTQTHCYNPVTPTYPVWAYYVHGRQRRCQEDPVSPPSSGLEKTTKIYPNLCVPTSRDSAPSNGIWNNTTLRSPKQQIWLRTTRLWRMMSTYGTTQSWSCMPETMTTHRITQKSDGGIFVKFLEGVETTTTMIHCRVWQSGWVTCKVWWG